jgi:hypothetical protein
MAVKRGFSHQVKNVLKIPLQFTIKDAIGVHELATGLLTIVRSLLKHKAWNLARTQRSGLYVFVFT